ncbi:hypothetical protein FIBSPDRAFT_940022 [Athelia psychrophila]|uniref:Uncharacterized protein n=1 Tax=Athelia psychrophila TaxID=1759441 RepID=A0A167WRS9_9AGAM|nr:hypothetical protein FIBSPDRAFT_940022 [Fibularhizoctonia sp. CBS 109695]
MQLPHQRGLTFDVNAAQMLITKVSYSVYHAQLTSVYKSNSLRDLGNIVASWAMFGKFKIGNIQSRIGGSLARDDARILPRGRQKNDGLMRYELDEIMAATELDRTMNANVRRKPLRATPGNRAHAGYCCFGFLLPMVWQWAPLLLINGTLAIYNLSWAHLAAKLVGKLGRRFLFLTTCTGVLISFLAQTFCIYQMISFSFLFYTTYNLALTPFIVSYTVEILSYLRAKGVISSILSSRSRSSSSRPPANPALAPSQVVCVVWLAFEGSSTSTSSIGIREGKCDHGATDLESVRFDIHTAEVSDGIQDKKRSDVEKAPLDLLAMRNLHRMSSNDIIAGAANFAVVEKGGGGVEASDILL